MPYKSQLHGILESLDFRIDRIRPSDFAETFRVMTTEVSPFPGKYNYDRTPYCREIVNCLDPAHPARIVSVMKGAQLGFTAGVIENGIGWIMRESPANIWYTVGHSELVPKSMMKVDQMIDSTGLRELIKPNSRRVKNQKTGDTNTTKEYPGGQLTLGITGNHKAIRNFTAKYGFIDDFEAMKGSSKESGSTRLMVEQRFTAFYESGMKLFYISTPEVKQTSNIEPAFLDGDQRHYLVPCPLCHEHIPLEWNIKVDGVAAGITWKLDNAGRVIEDSVGYVCQSCGGFFTDRFKHRMNLEGHWKPSAEAATNDHYSYHISALYAPVGMYDWNHYAQQYVKANPPDAPTDIKSLQTFYNVVLGKTWEERGQAIKVDQLALNAGRYEFNTIPNELSMRDGNRDIILITCACDLNGLEDDARLDYEIVGWSANGSSYSINHGSIGTFVPMEGAKKTKIDRDKFTYRAGQQNSVWPEFKDILEREYKCETGRIMQIAVSGVDTGHYTKHAYSFIEDCAGDGILIFGLKGKADDEVRKFGADTPTFKRGRSHELLYLVEVNQIKDELAELVRLEWAEEQQVEQPSGFMNFPNPVRGKYNMKDYFSHFQAEHKVVEKNAQGTDIGTRWVKRKSTLQNHLFDCRIYNMVLKDIYAKMFCEQNKIKDPGWLNFALMMESILPNE